MAKRFAKARAPAQRSSGAGTTALATGFCLGVVATLALQTWGPALLPALGAWLPDDRGALETAAQEADSDIPPARFDFYELLPNAEVTVGSGDVPRLQGDAPAARSPRSAEPQRFLLQAGSFRDAGDAEARRAQLTLLGFEPWTRTATLQGGEVWHRVLVGPFEDRDALLATKQRLTESRIDSLALALGPAKP